MTRSSRSARARDQRAGSSLRVVAAVGVVALVAAGPEGRAAATHTLQGAWDRVQTAIDQHDAGMTGMKAGKKADPSHSRSGGGCALSPAARGANQRLGRELAARRGWTCAQWTCLYRLWVRESGWRVRATNPSSGAYGIPQSLPAQKMAAAGADWRTSATTQIRWGLGYIHSRYGTPCQAWAHETSAGWY